MRTENVVTEFRRAKGEGRLAEKLGELAGTLSEIEDPALLERVGYVLRDLRAEQACAAGSGLTPIKVAVLSNFTCDPLENLLRARMLAGGLWPDSYVAGFNQYVQELLDPHSAYYEFAADLSVCLLDEHVIVDDVSRHWDVESIAMACREKLALLQKLVQTHCEQSKASLVLNTVPLSLDTQQQIVDYRSKAKLGRVWREFNDGLLAFAERHSQVIVLDVEPLLHTTRDGLRDPRLSYGAAMHFTQGVLDLFAAELVRVARAIKGKSKKCIVLDLDDTLWGGVLGDLGTHGIVFGHDGEGRPFWELQRCLRALKEQGVLLAVSSKNDLDNVLAALRDHPEMLLRRDDFVDIAANWEPKSHNIAAMAERLNLSVDSFVFLDNSAFEREQVRTALAGVTVPELSDDPITYATALLRAGYFNAAQLSEEDRQRTAMYRSEAARQELAKQQLDYTAYLRALEIQVELSKADELLLPRIAQLHQRTNQFNLTTRRLGMGELERGRNDPSTKLWAIESSDKFGAYGVIGCVLVEERSYEGARALYCRDFILSCRVFSRGIEIEVLRHLLRHARETRCCAVIGEFVASAKNRRFASFYADNGFAEIEGEGQVRRFRHDLQAELAPQPWLTLRVSKGEG